METMIVIGAVLAVIGIIGSVVPALPGPTLGFAALFLLYLSKGPEVVPVSVLVGFGIAGAVLILLDYVAPAIGAKFFGSTKWGLIGAVIGVVVGGAALFPWGVIVGPFLGAFLGEAASGKNAKEAAWAGVGTIIGSVMMTFFQVLYSLVAAAYFFIKLF